MWWSTPSEVRERIDRLVITLYDTDEDVVLEVEREGRLVNPFRLEMTPAGSDASRTWRVEVSAFDASGAAIAEGRLRGGYVDGELRDVVHCLEDACRDEFCASCVAGNATARRREARANVPASKSARRAMTPARRCVASA